MALTLKFITIKGTPEPTYTVIPIGQMAYKARRTIPSGPVRDLDVLLSNVDCFLFQNCPYQYTPLNIDCTKLSHGERLQVSEKLFPHQNKTAQKLYLGGNSPYSQGSSLSFTPFPS